LNAADLQDYAHLVVQVPQTAIDEQGHLLEGWNMSMHYVATSGSPSLSLFLLPAGYSGITYLTDSHANNYLGGVYPQEGKFAYATIDGQRDYTLAIGGDDVGNMSDGSLNFLFEGDTSGTGSVVITWTYKWHPVATSSLTLQLAPITQMYEQDSVINSAWKLPDDTVNGLGDLRDSHTPVIPSFVGQPSNPYTTSSPEDKTYVVFVHGWRMKVSEMTDYADAAFKRLYWQGYTGRFISFSWPTEWVDADADAKVVWDPGNFDRSEQKAWNSAQALDNLLLSLDGQYGYQNVNIFAHSMGNVVVSEALRLAATEPNPTPLVNAYIASQASSPAEAYDPGAAPKSNDVYANFMGTGKSYFADLNVAAPHMYNFYNPNDHALTSPKIWPLNNLLKPDHGYDFTLPLPTANYVRLSNYTVLSYAARATRYEAFAFAAQSASGALGRTANVGGPFNKGKQIDLSSPTFGFGSDHSGEFDGTETSKAAYWSTMMDDFGLPRWQE
jgi:hypothetical protein